MQQLYQNYFLYVIMALLHLFVATDLSHKCVHFSKFPMAMCKILAAPTYLVLAYVIYNSIMNTRNISEMTREERNLRNIVDGCLMTICVAIVLSLF